MEEVDKKENRATSRKFLFTIGFVLIESALVASSVITPEVYANMMSIAVMAYMTGNVAEKYSKRG